MYVWEYLSFQPLPNTFSIALPYGIEVHDEFACSNGYFVLSMLHQMLMSKCQKVEISDSLTKNNLLINGIIDVF